LPFGFFPQNPAFAGNACRWALDVKVAILLVGESVSAAVRRLGWPKFSCGGGDERVSFAAFCQRVGEAPKVGLVRVRLAGNCQRLAVVWVGLHFYC